MRRPHPNGSGIGVPLSFTYDDKGRQTSATDGNGNVRSYNYDPDSSNLYDPDTYPSMERQPTRVRVTVSKNGNVAAIYTHKIDAEGRSTGMVDNSGASTSIEYNDSQHPSRPTATVDLANRRTTMTYDDYGHLTSLTTPRGVTTTYTYAYNVWAMGRLMSVQQSANGSSKPARTFTYYEPSGLLNTVTGPHPNGSGTVTASFIYNAGGDVTSVTTPGNNATPDSVTEFSYTLDGDYSQPAKRGQPLAIRDNLGHDQHLRYDARGNVIASWDALGNRSDVSYNLADQALQVLAPATGQSGPGRIRTLNSLQLCGRAAQAGATVERK